MEARRKKNNNPRKELWDIISTMPYFPLDMVVQGDCFEILNRLPENSVDLVFADPPYNLQLPRALLRPDQSKVSGVDENWDKFDNFENYDNFTKKWLRSCRNALKDSGTLWVIGTYHNIYRIGTALQDLDFWILNDVVWVKNNPMPNFRGVRFTNAHETLLWVQKKKGEKYTFNHHSMKALNDDLQMRSDWYLPICKGQERYRVNGETAHATQKPEALLYRILMASTKPGDVVLDPFFGTGTTGVVAKKLGRHFIGIEKEKSYVQIAEKRISEAEPLMMECLPTSEPRHLSRIPFGNLLEAGWLFPGQTLHFCKDGKTAVILADGTLRCGDLTGSIHKVAELLLHSSANGWEKWYYVDANGQKNPLDELRKKMRSQIGEAS